MDFIQNGMAQGSVATRLLESGFDPRVLRPYVDTDGRGYITQNVGGKKTRLLCNTNATLRKDEWKLLDEAVIPAAKERLRIVADLIGAGLTFNIPNGMGTTVLQTENVSDVTGAIISMEPARKSEADRVEYSLVNLPLPVIHKDFFISARQLATSRNLGTPLDTTMAALCGRRVAEATEDLFISGSSLQFGSGSIYGITNFPQRLTHVMHNPTLSGWTPAKTIQELLAMKQQSQDAFHYGPWMLYTSPRWDQYLDDDYSTLKGDDTLRDRVKKIEGIRDVRTLDRLTGLQMILVQMTTDVIRAVQAMNPTTLQWETNGGLSLNWKVMSIIVPQIRADHNGNTGIVHGTAS